MYLEEVSDFRTLFLEKGRNSPDFNKNLTCLISKEKHFTFIIIKQAKTKNTLNKN